MVSSEQANSLFEYSWYIQNLRQYEMDNLNDIHIM